MYNLELLKEPEINKVLNEEKCTDLDSKILVQIAENSCSTLLCTEGGTNSKVNWYKDGKLLNISFRNNLANRKQEPLPLLTIDASNNLYIWRATKGQEGTYTCKLDNVKLHEYEIKVVSARILDHDFIRYSLYLGFILSLTVTCYCAGLCVAWHRRASFIDPLNPLYFNQNKNIRNGEREALLNDRN